MIILAIAAAASAAVPALPPGWKEAITKGDMLYTADALPTKLLPSVENGFLGGDVECSGGAGGSSGALHVSGIYSGNGDRPDTRATFPNPLAASVGPPPPTGAVPVPAATSNQFPLMSPSKSKSNSSLLFLDAGLDLRRAVYTSRWQLPAACGPDAVLSTATYAHRKHRQLLVKEHTAVGVTSRCSYSISPCSGQFQPPKKNTTPPAFSGTKNHATGRTALAAISSRKLSQHSTAPLFIYDADAIYIVTTHFFHGMTSHSRTFFLGRAGGVSAAAAAGLPGVTLYTVIAEEQSADPAAPRITATVSAIAADAVPTTVTLVPGDAGAPTPPLPLLLLATLRTTIEAGVSNSTVAKIAAADLATFKAVGAATLAKDHVAAWADVWGLSADGSGPTSSGGGVEVTGNVSLAAQINSSMYYLLSSVRSDWSV